MPGDGHVRCGGRSRETGRARAWHRALGRSHVRAIYAHARGLPAPRAGSPSLPQQTMGYRPNL